MGIDCPYDILLRDAQLSPYACKSISCSFPYLQTYDIVVYIVCEPARFDWIWDNNYQGRLLITIFSLINIVIKAWVLN